VTASADDARLEALRSLTALSGVTMPGERSAAAPSATSPLPLRILTAALRPLLDPYPSKRTPEATSFGHASCQGGCLAFAAEIAQVMKGSCHSPSTVLAGPRSVLDVRERGAFSAPCVAVRLCLEMRG